MNGDFFTQLEAELGGITRHGMHLSDGSTRGRRRLIVMLRRGLVVLALAIALAASLDSEFPATASGHPELAAAALTPTP
jgi:hypothetical protein